MHGCRSGGRQAGSILLLLAEFGPSLLCPLKVVGRSVVVLVGRGKRGKRRERVYLQTVRYVRLKKSTRRVDIPRG
jgi:hypothetical protein